jgi:hypothetical protein
MMDTPNLADILSRQVSEEPFSWRGFFERTHGGRKPLKPLGKPCHDCAVTCGFYAEYSDELAKFAVNGWQPSVSVVLNNATGTA